jgi:hypothetical protein
MRRLLMLSSVGMMLVLMHAQAADASMKGFLDYIFEMSGPGKFLGFGIEDEFMCIGTVLHVDTATLLELPPPSPPPPQVPPPPPPPIPEYSFPLHFQPQCAFLDQKKAQVHFYASGSVMHTDRIPDTYQYDALKQSLDEGILAIPALLKVDGTIPGLSYNADAGRSFRNRLFRGVLIGIGAGGIRFSGQRLDPFWTYSLEIPRITLKPGSFARPDSGRNGYLRSSDRVQIQFITKIIGAVRSEDFGALPGQKSGVYVREHVTFSISF